MSDAAFGLLGFTIEAIVVVGDISCKRPSTLPSWLMPVTLPPGLLKLATRPYRTGSPPIEKTIGIVAVAALAANDGAVPVAKIAAICLRTRSVASAGSRSY